MQTNPLIQRLPLGKDCSFLAKKFVTPEYETGWHQHIEYELVLILKGEGMVFIGNYVSEYQSGDVFFIGSNLPHTFPKKQRDKIASSIVIQFKEDFWGDRFLSLPESKKIRALLKRSSYGIQIKENEKIRLTQLIKKVEAAEGFERIIALSSCLHVMSRFKKMKYLSTVEANQLSIEDNDKINNVINYTLQSFTERIKLKDVADIACLSVSAFCKYFKKSTKKTYFDFLAEIRISHACYLLADTNKSIVDICYESGYNSLPNFHKQFLKIKKTVPLQYRKNFLSL